MRRIQENLQNPFDQFSMTSQCALFQIYMLSLGSLVDVCASLCSLVKLHAALCSCIPVLCSFVQPCPTGLAPHVRPPRFFHGTSGSKAFLDRTQLVQPLKSQQCRRTLCFQPCFAFFQFFLFWQH